MDEKQQMVFSINLSMDQVNVILSTMGKLPYETISPLMNSIQSQAAAQYQQYQQQQQQDAQNTADNGPEIIQ